MFTIYCQKRRAYLVGFTSNKKMKFSEPDHSGRIHPSNAMKWATKDRAEAVIRANRDEPMLVVVEW